MLTVSHTARRGFFLFFGNKWWTFEEISSDQLLLLQIYEGKIDPWVMSDNCTDNVPVLIKRATFCSAFAADARDFRQYNSWVRLLGFPVFL